MYLLSTARRRVAAVAVGVAAVPVILLAAHPSTATGTTSGSATLTFHFRPETFRLVDMPPKATGENAPPSPGDYFVLTNGLYKSGERVGALHATCVVTRKAAKPQQTPLLCSGSYKVPGGTLVGSALLRIGGSTSHIAVTGGTGQYAGARGTSTEVNKNNGSGTVTIELE
jgi:hypothetical protein